MWCVGQIGLYETFKFDKWLFEKYDVIDAVEVDFGCVQTVADSVRWKARIVLLTGKSFLLSCSDNATVIDERGRTVMVEGGDAE